MPYLPSLFPVSIELNVLQPAFQPEFPHPVLQQPEGREPVPHISYAHDLVMAQHQPLSPSSSLSDPFLQTEHSYTRTPVRYCHCVAAGSCFNMCEMFAISIEC